MWPETHSFRKRAFALLVYRCVSVVFLLLAVVPGTGTLAMEEDAATAYDAAQDAVAREEYGEAGILLGQWLLAHPDDAPARFLRARVLAWSGDRGESLEEFRLLMRNEPRNADYALAKARVLLWDQRPAEAAICLQLARILRPEFEDLWRLELQALRASDGSLAEKREQALLIEARKRFPDASWAAADSSSTTSPRSHYLQVTAGLTREYLSNDLPDWSSALLQADYHFDARRMVYAGLRHTERFNSRDVELSLGVGVPTGDHWTASLEVAVSPDADVLPEVTASIRVARALAGGWGVGLAYRHASYTSTYADVASLSMERYWRAYRFAYRISSGKAEDAERTFSHELRSDYYYRDLSMVGLSLVNGQESESVGLGRLVTSDVVAVSIQGLHWFTEDWAVSWRVGYHRQGELYNRAGVDIAFRHRF